MTNRPTLRKQQAADRFILEPLYRATIHIHGAARLFLLQSIVYRWAVTISIVDRFMNEPHVT